jgi:hypothetical protein
MSSKLLPLLACAGLVLGCQATRNADDAGNADGAQASADAAARPPAKAAKPASADAADARRREPAAAADADSSATASRPRSEPPPVVVPAGTELQLELATSHSSATSQEGDVVVARLASPVKAQDRVVLAAGTEVRGRVTAAVPSGRVKGRARLAVAFDRVVVAGRERAIDAAGIDVTADSSKKRDAAIIGGSAGAGAIIGAIAKGGKGAAVGAAVGGAAGTGAVLATKGKEVELPAGTAIQSRLESELRLSGS